MWAHVMPQRCSNVFAWMRTVMSRVGPATTTRLVLYAHSLFMNRDGTHCRVGVRRLAEVTGFDKSTAIASVAGTRPSREGISA
jgi:hypothetical protein